MKKATMTTDQKNKLEEEKDNQAELKGSVIGRAERK